ncbi:DUF7146 domain-containing protein [Bradyrhizobium oligotrophicum S58]
MNRLSDAELEDIKARNPLAEVAARYVPLRKMGRRMVGPCPVCGGSKSSVRFEVRDDGWVCAVCNDGGDVIRLVERADGVDFRGAIERLGGAQGVDAIRAAELAAERDRKRAAREAEAAKYREAERKRLYRAWREAMPIHETPAAAYLAGRGLALPAVCPGLRYLPKAPYFHGDEIDQGGRKTARVLHRGPAMLAAFIRADGTFGGLHTTWLADDGACIAKLEISDPETGEILPAKKMRGSKTGAFILVAKAATPVPRRLIIGEGIETVLAVYTAHVAAGRAVDDTAFWAAGDLGNLAGRAIETLAHPTLKRPDGRSERVAGPVPDPDQPGLSIPDGVTELILLGDGDSEPVLTSHAMTRAARRYAKPGRTIRIAMAPAGMDFNDLLQGKRDEQADAGTE